MKPPSFDYRRPTSVPEALAYLEDLEDAKILAGGQSLIPMMNMRLARPHTLIDINGIAELKAIREENDHIIVGALVRHYQLQFNRVLQRQVPMIGQAERLIGHEAIRTRGTIGGSLSHADPQAELPVLATLLDWDMVVQSRQETRSISAREFFLSYFVTALAPNELVTAIVMPRQKARGHIAEYAIRSGDFALAIAAVTLSTTPTGLVESFSVALGGIGDVPWRNPEWECQWINEASTNDLFRDIAESITHEIEPTDDFNASADYRRKLVSHLVLEALKEIGLAQSTDDGTLTQRRLP